MLLKLRDELFSDRRRRGWPEEIADEAGHHFLLDHLHEHRPNDGILSEEGPARRAGNRMDHDRVWIVDPLDGSADFGRGAGDWAVHVALVEDGRATAGAVSLPTAGMVFDTKVPPTVPPQKEEAPVVVAGRSRVHYDGARVAEEFGASLMTCGSAGVKAMLVVMGEADIYVHGSPLYEWDVCAPAVVAQAAGLHVSAIDGSDFVFNQKRPVVGGFLVCRPEYADRTIAALRY